MPRPFSTADVMPLGRQCLQCKKRRVKCGSEEPGCDKCHKDGLSCPGYSKALQWIEVQPQNNRNVHHNATNPISDSSGHVLLPEVRHVDAVSTESDQQCQVQNHVPDCVALHASGDLHANFERAIHYFNTEILRDLSATYWQTRNVSCVQQWAQVPEMLRNMLVTSVLITQSIRSDTNSPQIYRYRSRVIEDLKDYLQQKSDQPPAILLAATLGMLQQELHMSPVGGFVIHLVAAQRVVENCGGIRRCREIWPLPLRMIIMFAQADVLSATTSHANTLTVPRVRAQQSYAAAFDDFADESLDSPLPCPLPLFLSIVRVNSLRSASQLSSTTTLSSWRDEFFEITRSVHEFNATEWAKNLPCLPQGRRHDLDSTFRAASEWICLASCYQSATIIYLIESLKNRTSLKTIDLSETSSILLDHAQQHLRSNLQQLFIFYPDRQTTAEKPTLWRFVQWPLMIYAFRMIVLGQERHSPSTLLGTKSASLTLSQELGEIGKSLGSRGIIDGVAHFDNVASREGPSVWDEVFERSLVFYL